MWSIGPAVMWDGGDAGRRWRGESTGVGQPGSLTPAFRLVLIHGPRRGEAVGPRWAGYLHGTVTAAGRNTLPTLPMADQKQSKAPST